MSGQQQQRVRRNASPATATKQGPMKATLPVAALMRPTGSPPPQASRAKKISPSDSPTATFNRFSDKRQSPDHRISPEWKATGSPVLKEKNRTLNIKGNSVASGGGGGVSSATSGGSLIRRTNSLDTLYLATPPSSTPTSTTPFTLLYGTYCGSLMVDRSTQTPETWEDSDKKKGQSTKVDVGLEMKYIRQRLRSTQISRSQQGQGSQSPTGSRFSPVQHPAHPTSISFQSPSMSYQQGTPPTTGANPIPIPHIPKPLIPRMRSSVEGLNQEIEKLVLKAISANEEGESDRMQEPTPDGHRAPIAKLFGTSGQLVLGPTSNVDTQTPSVGGPSSSSSSHLGDSGLTRRREEESSSGSTSRSHSVSPIVPLIPGLMDTFRPTSTEDRKSGSPEELSPSEDRLDAQINKFLAREPPDGCDKTKPIEERKKRHPLIVEPSRAQKVISSSGPASQAVAGLVLRPTVNFVLMPSQCSAFHPLGKTCLSPPTSSHQWTAVQGSTTEARRVNSTPPLSQSP